MNHHYFTSADFDSVNEYKHFYSVLDIFRKPECTASIPETQSHSNKSSTSCCHILAGFLTLTF